MKTQSSEKQYTSILKKKKKKKKKRKEKHFRLIVRLKTLVKDIAPS